MDKSFVLLPKDKPLDEEVWVNGATIKKDTNDLVLNEDEVLNSVKEGIKAGLTTINTGNFTVPLHHKISELMEPTFYYMLAEDFGSIKVITFEQFWSFIKEQSWFHNLYRLNNFTIVLCIGSKDNNWWFERQQYAIVHNYLTFLKKNTELTVVNEGSELIENSIPICKIAVNRKNPVKINPLPEQFITINCQSLMPTTGYNCNIL